MVFRKRSTQLKNTNLLIVISGEPVYAELLADSFRRLANDTRVIFADPTQENFVPKILAETQKYPNPDLILFFNPDIAKSENAKKIADIMKETKGTVLVSLTDICKKLNPELVRLKKAGAICFDENDKTMKIFDGLEDALSKRNQPLAKS